ncbi:peptidyl-tRNA hydrolase domain-containing protein [Colletotrichum orchidophilum]|uniref:Peptidyl-tRNA hydrolase domain-containing protein n=1 Tax=Colletotrichum orchidophilum TaxID=1209926 RepID=A0A1G4BSJ4_9PEZI|nr:peptidyl-tRNA hydrolase domain-containing protein [Colletotrichum orchidophilum]OHF04432.1 peptidyl-tRNA hydrolase domain-containing protein [Colletotrichum orchidophilum]
MNLATSMFRSVRPALKIPFIRPLQPVRWARFQAYEADFDPEELEKARSWHRSFNGSQLPKGQTSFARSSGPGGQHVNKTESKAVTVWPIKDILPVLPKLLHQGIRESKYYTARSDSLTFQAQTHRQREANSEENQQKLVDEIKRIYQETVPGETSPDKKKKHAEIAKSFNEGRLRQKKQLSSKKQNRRSSFD